MSEGNENKPELPVSMARRAADAVESARSSNHRWAGKQRQKRQQASTSSGSWKRDTQVLPRKEARAYTRAFLKKYPKAAYWSEVESWRVLEGDIIEFTLRRLPSAD